MLYKAAKSRNRASIKFEKLVIIYEKCFIKNIFLSRNFDNNDEHRYLTDILEVIE